MTGALLLSESAGDVYISMKDKDSGGQGTAHLLSAHVAPGN